MPPCKGVRMSSDGPAPTHGLKTRARLKVVGHCTSMLALRHHGGALQFASERLRDDKEVVLLACEESHKAAKHASARLLEDLNVIAASQPPEKESRGRSMGRSFDHRRK